LLNDFGESFDQRFIEFAYQESFRTLALQRLSPWPCGSFADRKQLGGSVNLVAGRDDKARRAERVKS